MAEFWGGDNDHIGLRITFLPDLVVILINNFRIKMTCRRNHYEYPSLACTYLDKYIHHLYYTLIIKAMASKLTEPLEIKQNYEQ